MASKLIRVAFMNYLLQRLGNARGYAHNGICARRDAAIRCDIAGLSEHVAHLAARKVQDSSKVKIAPVQCLEIEIAGLNARFSRFAIRHRSRTPRSELKRRPLPPLFRPQM